MEVEFDILGGHDVAKFTNVMLHACDLYEKGKQYCIHTRISYCFEEQRDLRIILLEVANAMEKHGGYAVFLGIRKVDGKRGDWPCWFKPGVQSIGMEQDGKLGWSLFKDILHQLNYTAKTDDKMNVIEVS